MDLGLAAVNDAFKLVVALAFLPIVFRIGRKIRIPESARPFTLGVIALVFSFAVNFIAREFGWNQVQWLRWVRHLSVAVSGFSFAWAAWKLRVRELAAGGQR